MGRSRWVIVAAIALGACGPDSTPFGLSFVLQRGDTNTCSSDSCEGIPMSCDVAMSVRIASAADDSAYVSRCFYIAGGERDLCSLTDIELPAEMIPNEMVKVQVTVWRQSDLPQAMQDDQECPPGVTFDLQNTPSADPSPVLGGQSYFKVGSSATADVTLQCMYAELLGECSGFTTHVTATVQDFSNFLFPVVPAKAGELVVAAVGPTIAPGNGQWVIDPTDVVSLTLGQISPLPLWDGDLAHAFERALCVQVFDPTDFAAATSVQCVRLDDDAEIKEGMLVPTSSLDAVSTAIGEIPETGVVLGVVLDANGQPADGVTITPTFGTVQYLSPDLTSTLDGLGVPLRETTASGAFVSTDVPFGTATELTQWTADKLIAGEHVNEQRAALGGLVRGKLTFVKLVLKPSP